MKSVIVLVQLYLERPQWLPSNIESTIFSFATTVMTATILEYRGSPIRGTDMTVISTFLYMLAVLVLFIGISPAKGRSVGSDGWTSCPGRCFDGVCRDVGNFKNLSIDECQHKCLNTTRCTAINYGHSSCALRACPVGTPPEWPIHGLIGFAHYSVNCSAPKPPTPNPSPSPPTPPPTPKSTPGNQVHLSLGSTPNTYVVTWSTNHSLSAIGGSLVELVLVDSPSKTRTVLGNEDIFVDNGTLHHSQFMHRAALTALVSGSRYSYRVTCDGGKFCQKRFEFVAVFRMLDDPASFTVFGDMGIWNNKAFDQLVADAAKRDTDVLIHNGISNAYLRCMIS